MTSDEAAATHAPAWVGIWLNILLLGKIVLPLSLFIWKQTRLVALAAFIAGVVRVLSQTSADDGMTHKFGHSYPANAGICWNADWPEESNCRFRIM